jgi:hypothetical protein
VGAGVNRHAKGTPRAHPFVPPLVQLAASASSPRQLPGLTLSGGTAAPSLTTASDRKRADPSGCACLGRPPREVLNLHQALRLKAPGGV